MIRYHLERLIMLRQLAGLAGGLLYSLLMLFFALVLHGPEHGWIAPFFASLPGVLLIPITSFLLFIPEMASETAQIRRTKTAWFILYIILALDILFIAVTIYQVGDLLGQWPGIISPMVLGLIPWAALWALWHYVVIRIATERM
jgi:hypothetical protein